jgi:hypothetical protein
VPTCSLLLFQRSQAGKTQIEYGLMTDLDTRPISIERLSGST